MRPGRVVAATKVNRGSSSLIDRAVGPLPNTTSSTKSSNAGYRTSSTGRGIRWISSTNNTSPSSRLVRMAARSLGRSSAGPDVGVEPRGHLGGHDLGQRRLAQPRWTAEQQVVDGFGAAPRAVDQQRQLFLHPLLTHELGERTGAQRDVELAILRVDDGGFDQAVVVHVSGPPSAGLPATDPRPRGRRPARTPGPRSLPPG